MSRDFRCRETVASALSSGESVCAPTDRPVTFFGDTSIQLVGACREVAACMEARAMRLNTRLDDASQRIQMLHLDASALGESVGRPERCHAARCRARGAASIRISAGMCEVQRHIVREPTSLGLGRSMTAQRVAALSRVGIPFDLRPALGDSLAGAHPQAPLVQGAHPAPVALGSGGPRALGNTRSAVTVVDPVPLGVTIRVVPAATGEYVSLVLGDVQQGSVVEKVAGPGSQLLAINGVDCRLLFGMEARAKAEDMLRKRPVELEFDSARRSIFDVA